MSESVRPFVDGENYCGYAGDPRCFRGRCPKCDLYQWARANGPVASFVIYCDDCHTKTPLIELGAKPVT